MIQLKINDVDKSALVEWQSTTKVEVLTKEPDTLRFRIKNYDSKTYRPELGDEVTLFDGATKIFGGVVVDTQESVDGLLKYFEVNATKDFTHTLDRKLVANTYSEMSAEDIIADIIDNFTDPADGFTYANVVAPDIVHSIVFNYDTVSEALKKLTNYLGNYAWYVDYDKDIHFFEKTTQTAPFNLTDVSANFIWNSLRIKENIHQLRNHIIIRGGDVEGDAVTNEQIADGFQRVFFIGYSLTLSSLLIEKSLAATPTTFFTLSVGRDGVDNPASFDTLYNPNQGLLIFPNSSKPAVNDHIKTSGVPTFPLIAEKINVGSVAEFGTYQYLIIDKRIRTRAGASQRADAELEKYSEVSKYGSFKTYTSGLRAGQWININSVIRDINQSFLIERITTRLRTPDTLEYEIEMLASEDVTMIDVLNRLLSTDPLDQLSVGENEIVDVLYSVFEDVDLNEVVVVSTSHNPQSETMDLDETDILQPLDYATIFVLGPYIPTIAYDGADKKRVFILDGSYLG